MKLPTKFFAGLFLLATVAFTISSCSNNDDNPAPVPQKVSYDITAYGDSQISGNATFTEILNTDSVIVTIKLKGSAINQTTNLEVKILEGTSIENGEVLYDLGNYNGSQSELVKRIKLAYSALANFNGSITIYSGVNIMSQAEIGSNATYKTIKMEDPNTHVQNGQARIYKRGTGSLLVIQLPAATMTSLPPDCQGKDLSAYVIDASTGSADPNITLNAVADSTGISITELPNNVYKDFKGYNGSLSIWCEEVTPNKHISEGDF